MTMTLDGGEMYCTIREGTEMIISKETMLT